METIKDIIAFLGALWEATKEVVALIWNGAVLLFGVILAIIVYLTDGDPRTLSALVVCMLCDYLTGIIKALKLNGKLDFYIGFFGIFKKAVIILVITAVSRLDILLNIENLRLNCFFMIVCFYTSNEIISILENVTVIGIKAPKQLKTILEQLKEINIKK